MTDTRYDNALEAHVDESRGMNDLIRTFMEGVDVDWGTSEGLHTLRTTDLMPGREPLDHAEVRTLPSPDGGVPVRILVPERVEGVYLEIHGGGWCIGSAEQADQDNWALANAAGVATVSVDYRLAPEHPWPAGPDDCEAAAVWVVENAKAEFGTERVLIGGGSAGGHLSAVTLLRLRDRHDAAGAFAAANLVFGAFDLGMTESQLAGHDALLIPRAVIEQCYAYAFPGLSANDRRAPDISPLYADLHDLPPALFTVGTLDPLLDDSVLLAERWAEAGNEAELAIYPESVHGFVAFPTELARLARQRITEFVARHAAGG